MTLVLEIEYLSGVAFAATGPDSGTPEWPPQPDRIFSALVASWAARGSRGDERQALEWLERRPPPRIRASGYEPRVVPVSFVPPNDPETRRVGDIGVMPARRRRQPRRFPAALPHVATMCLVWDDAEADPDLLAALDALARDTSYVGHSASLTRCRFVDGLAAATPDNARQARRRVYQGRLAELEAVHGRQHRPSPGDRVRPSEAPDPPIPASSFSPEWLLLDHIAGEMPDIRAAAPLAKMVRDTIMSGYREAGLGDSIPESVSGHAPDGSPTKAAHLAVVPLAFAGFAHADGRVLGFALVPPRNCRLFEDPDFRRAMSKITKRDDDGSRRVLKVKGNGPKLWFAVVRESHRQSLNRDHYVRPSRTFATVTPIVLDRHLKTNSDARQTEIEAIIRDACRNIGLPDPMFETTTDDNRRGLVVADKHSAIEAAPSAYPSGRAPGWMRWQVPPSLASRSLTHAVIRFAEPVEGPVILGAGRFVGLGLCRVLDEPIKGT